jgi:peptide/nickel transport system substrate-binding protein
MDAPRSVGDRATEGPDPVRARPPTSYLFCDIRGYTSYTATNGAEAAAALVETFLTTAFVVVTAHQGILRGSWGDQVLAEFVSARDAVRAALDLVQQCVHGNGALPLCVGVGLDAGEPAGPAETSSSAALNLGARLCAAAGPGEVLATREIVHLAGTLPGVVAQDRGPRALKGIPGKVPVVRLVDTTAPVPQRGRAPRRAVPWLVGAVALVVLAGTVVVLRDADRPGVVATQGLTLLDEHSGSVRRSTELGRSLAGMAPATGAVWAVEGQAESVVRLDRASGRVTDTVPVGSSPSEVAVDGDDVWVVNTDAATVSKINGRTGRVVATVDVGAGPTDVAVALGRVWVTNGGAGTLSVLDAVTGDLVDTVDVGDGPAGVAVGAGRVWVSLADEDRVVGLDPVTLEAVDSFPVGTGPGALVAGPTAVWVANTLGRSVSHIDPRAHQVRAVVPVGDDPTSLAVDGVRLWVGNAADGTLTLVDPARDRALRTVYLAAVPTGLGLGRDGLWVATRPFAPAVHRGGTLMVATQYVPDELDPQRVYDPVNFPVVSLVHATLLTVRRAQGVQGGLVPDLALSIPRPTHAGREYRFTLRPDVHYSDGRLLVPGDVRRGVERAFTAVDGDAGAPELYTRIRGAQACLRARTCDLSTGITTGADSVTFHLDRPDPDFLYKLALPLVSPAPPGTPAGRVRGRGPVGTGPYKVTKRTADRVELTRNPWFRQWSYAAQPAGNPDSLVWRRVDKSDAGAAVRAVDLGHADVALHVKPPALDRVAVSAPDRVLDGHSVGTHFVLLNTRVAPFDDLRARQAVAFALDRTRLAALFSGSRRTACRLLPPGFPARTRTCRYTQGQGSDGEWHGPDLRQARELVARSGTAGATVDVSVYPDSPGGEPAALALAEALDRLGYRTRLRQVPSGKGYWTWMGDAGRPVQAGLYGFQADYPAPGNFYEHVTLCPRGPAATTSDDLTGLCDPEIEHLVAEARQAAASDPALATRLWQQAYAHVEDSAAVIPFDYWQDVAYAGTRVGNAQTSSYWGPLLEQMWVR